MAKERGQGRSRSSNEVSFQDVPGGFPKSDLLGVTVAFIHVVGQQFWQYEMALTNKGIPTYILKIANP